METNVLKYTTTGRTCKEEWSFPVTNYISLYKTYIMLLANNLDQRWPTGDSRAAFSRRGFIRPARLLRKCLFFFFKLSKTHAKTFLKDMKTQLEKSSDVYFIDVTFLIFFFQVRKEKTGWFICGPPLNFRMQLWALKPLKSDSTNLDMVHSITVYLICMSSFTWPRYLSPCT